MQIDKWSILSDISKYVQHNQYPIGHYELVDKALKQRYGAKMYEKLHIGEREIMEINFDSNTDSLKQNDLDIFEGVKSHVMYIAHI